MASAERSEPGREQDEAFARAVSLDWSFTYRVWEARQVFMAGAAEWYHVTIERRFDGSMHIESSVNYSNREELFAAALLASLDSDPVRP